MRTPWLPRLKLRQRLRLVPGAASKNQRRLGWRGSPSLFGDQVAATVACPQLTNDHSSLVNRVLLLNTHRVATLLRAEKEGGKNYSHFLTTKCTFGYLLQYSETCLVLHTTPLSPILNLRFAEYENVSVLWIRVFMDDRIKPKSLFLCRVSINIR